MARLTADQWQAIRTLWEYDPDEPTFNDAARRASEKFKFEASSKTTIDSRAKKEGWKRHGFMNGIVSAAQRKADKMVNSDGSTTVSDGAGAKISDASEIQKEQASRVEAEDKRAEVLARHRREWQQVAALRQEAVAKRKSPTSPGCDDGEAFQKGRLAKIIAETTALQQAGERKAWGLDIQVDPGSVKDMTDEQLAAIVAGKVAG